MDQASSKLRKAMQRRFGVGGLDVESGDGSFSLSPNEEDPVGSEADKSSSVNRDRADDREKLGWDELGIFVVDGEEDGRGNVEREGGDYLNWGG